MALVRCPDCRTEVSDQAEACRQCGRPIRSPKTSTRTPRKTSPTTWGCLILVVLAVIGGIVTESNKPSGGSNDAEQEKENAAAARAQVGARILKRAMRDPDSFKLDSALVMTGSNAVCYDYRAKNGFGGYNVGHAVLAPDGTFETNEMSGFSSLWKKHCAGKRGTEEATAINQ